MSRALKNIYLLKLIIPRKRDVSLVQEALNSIKMLKLLDSMLYKKVYRIDQDDFIFTNKKNPSTAITAKEALLRYLV